MMRKLSRLVSFGLVLLILLSLTTHGEEIIFDEKVITFTQSSKLDRSIVLEIPKDAEITEFQFELTGPLEPGPDQPWNLTLDIGENGTIDWAMKYEYGPLGFQKVFNTGEPSLDITFVPENYNTKGEIYLPVTADISKASLKFKYTSEDLISPSITELNRPEWHPDAPFDYDPELCVFQDRLYVAYRSYSWRDSNQSDADIVVNSTADGITWQEETIEITKAPDTEVPYTGGKRSGDFYPSMALFKDHLYCAWEADSELPLGSTDGIDRDIVWSRFDGSTWSAPEELTATTEQAAEDTYSKNPGAKDDYRVQLCTFNNGTGEQLFAIWTANNTGDEQFPEDRKGDIIISRTTDGEHWTVGSELTLGDRRYDEDYLPQLIEYKTSKGNALYAFWVTNNDQITKGNDWDIVYKYTFDGVTWSEHHDLLEACNITESNVPTEAIDDDPSVVVFNDQLYVLWRSSNPVITSGEDIDIVMTGTSDGFNWSIPVELTPETDSSFTNRPRASVYNNDLIVTWVTWHEVNSVENGTIFVRIINTTKNPDQWPEPIKLSVDNKDVNDFSPDIIAFDDKIIVAWVSMDNISTPGVDSDLVVRWLVPRKGIPEIALDIGNLDEYDNDWLVNKRTLSEGEIVNVDFTQKLKEQIANKDWLKHHSNMDEFGNDMIFVPINVYFSAPGKITLSSLEILYNYSFLVPDLGVELAEYIKSYGKNDDIKVHLKFGSDTTGKLKIQKLKVKYTTKTGNGQYPELLCIISIGIVLIILGVVIKLSGSRNQKRKNKNRNNNDKESAKPKRPDNIKQANNGDNNSD